MSLSLNVVKEKEKEEDIEKKGQNENEGDIEESQVSMVIDVSTCHMLVQGSRLTFCA
jgi:hypothetical protein